MTRSGLCGMSEDFNECGTSDDFSECGIEWEFQRVWYE